MRPLVRFIRRSRSVFLVVALLGGLMPAAVLLGGLALGAPAAIAAPSQALALGNPGNENWAAFDIAPDNHVRVAVYDPVNNVWYMGGDFVNITSTLGTVVVTGVNRIAVWDPSSGTWSALCNVPGLESSCGMDNGGVYALALDSVGNLYAGGTFTTISTTLVVSGVAKWNRASQTWEAVGGGITGGTVQIRAMAIDGSDNLYVGGDFTDIGTCTTNCARLAMWNGTTWSVVGGGINSDAVIQAMAYDRVYNKLYIGSTSGSLKTVTNTSGITMPVRNVAQWDPQLGTWYNFGGTCTAPGSGLCGTNGQVTGLTIDRTGNMYMVAAASSAYDISGTVAISRSAKWDPTRNSGAGGWVALCGTPTNPAACGWAGGTPRSVAVDSADNVYVINNANLADGTNVNYIAKWNPAPSPTGTWSAMGSGINYAGGFPMFLSFGDGYLLVGGNNSFTTTGGLPTLRLARWTAAEGRDISSTVPHTYTFYAYNLPVAVTVMSQGDLARINMQRFNTNHPSATAPLQTGYYWQIEGLNPSGEPATGFTVNLTLPANGFTPDVSDKVCYYTGSDWNCAMSAYNATSITRNGITSFSDWTTGNFTPTYTYLPVIMRQ